MAFRPAVSHAPCLSASASDTLKAISSRPLVWWAAKRQTRLPMTSTLDDSARAAFADAFGADPTVLARAPGRVELLGNHTDYNGGLVLAAAIDRYTVVVGRPVAGREARVRSANLEQTDAFAIDAIAPGAPGTWGRYVRGVAWALQERFGPLASGFEAAIAGDVPLGAGLSSSASVQAAVALFLRHGRPGRRGSRDAPRRPGPHGAGPPAAAVGERVRRGRNRACSTSSRPSSAGPATPWASTAGAWTTSGSPWAIPRPRSSSATRRPRDGWPTACTTAAARSASESSRSSRDARARRRSAGSAT